MNTFKNTKKTLSTLILTTLLTTLLFISYFLPISNITVFADDNLVKPTKEFYVNDYADILDTKVEEYIINTNEEFEKTLEKPQVVVTTVHSLNDLPIEDYAVKLFEKFKIGNKDYDNGILVLLAPNEGEIKIEVGYGLEGAISDSRSGEILDESLTYLSDEDYSTGIESIFTTICEEIADEYDYNITDIGIEASLESLEAIKAQERIKHFKETAFYVVLFVIFFIILILDAFFNNGRLLDFLQIVLHIVLEVGGSSGGRNSGGGGRSGGGGASRKF